MSKEPKKKDFKTKEIKGAKTTAQKLKAARKRHGISLEDVEINTNIRLKYLKAFEDNTFNVFPSEVYAIGFLRRYAEYLQINPNPIISQYKIEWNAAISRLPVKKHQDDFSPKGTLPSFEFSITPRTIAIIAVFIIVAGLLVYIWWAVKKFSAPPILIISKPHAEQVITDDKVLVEGRTDPGTYVYINNEAIDVGQDGRFSQVVSLGVGMNTLQVTAKNRLDRRSIHVIKVVDEQK